MGPLWLNEDTVMEPEPLTPETTLRSKSSNCQLYQTASDTFESLHHHLAAGILEKFSSGVTQTGMSTYRVREIYRGI